MRRSSIPWVLVFVGVVSALPAALAFASSSKEKDPTGDLRAGIAKHVTDPERASRMTASVDEMERTVQTLGALAVRQSETLAPLLRDYGRSREEIEAKLAEVADQRTALARKMLEAHAAFKKETTAAEWKKLAKLEERALAYAAAKSVGQEPFVPKEQ